MFEQTMRAAQSFDAADAALESVLAAAKESFKRQALEAHPDRCGGSEERMKALSAAWNVIKDMKVNRPQPMTVIRIFATAPASQSWMSSSSTTDAGWSGF
jgi:hypothetical protein